MPALNRVTLIGRLGKDPDLRFTPNGKKVAHFSLAVSQRWKSNGETREYVEWVNVEAWGRLAEICQQYLGKGKLIYLDGRLRTDRYEDKGGETRYFTKIVMQNMQMLERKPNEPETPEEPEEAPAEYESA